MQLPASRNSVSRSMTEAGLSRRIINFINSQQGCKAIKIHGGSYTESGTPDIIACIRGLMILIETKLPKGGNPTRIQRLRMDQWQNSGARVLVCRNLDDVKKIIEAVSENEQ